MQIINENKKIPGKSYPLYQTTPGWYASKTYDKCFYEVIKSEAGKIFYRAYGKHTAFVPTELKEMNEERTIEVVPIKQVGWDSFEYTEDRVPNRDEDFIEISGDYLIIQKDGKATSVCILRINRNPETLHSFSFVLDISQLIFNGELL